jgi:hypothetical protein
MSTFRGDPEKVLTAFDACYAEIKKMLLQNVLSKLEVQPVRQPSRRPPVLI